MRTVQLARRFAPADWGGTETVILETSRRLVQRGLPTEVLCTTATDPEPSSVIEGVPVTRVPYFYPYFGLSEAAQLRLDKKGGSPFSFQMLGRLASIPNLNLIHCHVGNRIGGIGRFVARRRGIPYVVSIHGGLFDVPAEEAASWTAPAEHSLEWGKVLGLIVGSRRLLQDAAAILCVGHRERELTQERYPRQRVIHLPNGVDSDQFRAGNGGNFRRSHGIAENAFVFLTVARIDPQKNQRLVIRTLPRLLEVSDKAHVVFIGSPSDERHLEDLRADVAAGRLARHVTIIPGLAARSPELSDAYHAANVFLLPSIHEPFGIVILEAWAAGLAVLASRVGGVPHFVQDGADGLLFAPGDEVALYQAAKTLMHSVTLRKQLAAAGNKKAVGEYGWDRVTDKLVEVYREAIHDARRPRFSVRSR